MLLIVIMLLLTFGVPTAAVVSEDIKVYVNAVQTSFPDQKPMINSDNRTLVPVRFVSQALGATVDWDDQTKQVTIQHNGKTIVLEIGKREAKVGESIITLDTNADIVNNRTMVPLRFISECMGAEVQWNGAKREVYISTKMPPANPFVGQSFKPSDLPRVTGTTIAGSNKPGAQIMYADASQLPITVGRYVVYNLSVDSENINITQYMDTTTPQPIDLYMVENGKLIRGRCYDFVQKGKLFTYGYSIYSTLDDTPTDITKVSDFALFDYDNMEFRMLVIPNPAYKD